MTPLEIAKLQAYLQSRFNRPDLNIQPQANKTDSAEIHFGDEFVAVVYRDEDEGEVCYQVNMAILDIDLEGAIGSA
ncbi:MAG: DUF3126 family protein [Pseudomonadota bacterium]